MNRRHCLLAGIPAALALTPLGSVASTASIVAAASTAVDARIEIVWPHPIADSLVNVAVDLFQHPIPFEFPGGPVSTVVGTDLGKSVWLLRSLNDGYLERVMPSDQTITARGSVVWPRYVFNDVDVSAARDPTNKYYFAIDVDGVTTHTATWAHGADARTYFPQRDSPATSGTACS